MSAYTKHNSKFYYSLVDDKYSVIDPVTWHVGSIYGPTIEVPEDFNFDVSIPKILVWLFDPHDKRYIKAACLHDYMLSELKWNRLTAAAEFHEALLADKVPIWRRLVMFLATALYRYK